MEATTVLLYVLCVIVGVLIGAILAAFLKRSQNYKQLEEKITALKDRVDQVLQSPTATQQQVLQLQEGLNNAREALSKLGSDLQSLTNFTQNTLHQTASQNLTEAIKTLSTISESLRNLNVTLSNQSQDSSQRHSDLLKRLQEIGEGLVNVQSLVTSANTTITQRQQELSNTISLIQTNLASAKTLIDQISQQVSILQTLHAAVEKIEENVERLTSTLLGRTSGKVGEQLIEELLQTIPDDWIVRNARLGTGEVEFAVKMPGSYLIPLDSKFVAPELLHQLQEAEANGDSKQREALEKQLETKVRARAEEVQKYINDERTLGFGLAAVPDPVYTLCRRALKRLAQDSRVVVVPYSQIVPYILSLYLMAQRLGISVRLEESQHILATAYNKVKEAEEQLNNMDRSLSTLSNQRKRALDAIEDVIRHLERLGKGDQAWPDLGGGEEIGPFSQAN